MFSFNPLAYLLGGSTIALAVALGGVTISKNSTIHELRHQVTSLQTQLDTTKRDLTTARNNNKVLQEGVDSQNKEITRLNVEGQARQKLIDAMLVDNGALKRSKSILDRKGATCEDADKLILELIR